MWLCWWRCACQPFTVCANEMVNGSDPKAFTDVKSPRWLGAAGVDKFVLTSKHCRWSLSRVSSNLGLFMGCALMCSVTSADLVECSKVCFHRAHIKNPESTIEMASRRCRSSAKEMQAIINRQRHSVDGEPLWRTQEADHVSNL